MNTYFTVYETTNLVNNKKYRGAHETLDPLDSYLGSGQILNRAIEKHGAENFKKEILEYCLNETHMYEREAFYVDEDWVTRKDTYNE